MASTTPDRDPGNPYAPPTAPLGDPQMEASAHHGDATKGQRFLNLIVDQAVMYVAAIGLGVVLALAGRTDLLEEAPVSWLYGPIISVVYYIIFEGFGGRTLGKLLTGTRVMSESGGRPTLGQVVGRTLMRIVPFESFSFLGSTDRGWHDTVSHTRVVRLRPSRLQRRMAEVE